MSGADDWIPYFGLAGYSSMSNRELAAALEAIRRRVCGYMGTTCDCKRGIAGRVIETDHPHWHRSPEATGCYELRVAISKLLNE